MSSYRTEAVVIKTGELGEADRLLTIYTSQRGKLSVIAKGAKKPLSRKAGSIDLLSHVTLFLAEGRSLDIILEASLINPYRRIREDLSLIASCYKIAELVDQFAPLKHENKELFRLLTQVLSRINSASDQETSANLFRSFEVKLLSQVGFRPQLVTCVNCSKVLNPVSNKFSAALGGILCGACGNLDTQSRPISAQALKILRFLQDESFEQIEKLKYPKILSVEVEQQIGYYLEYLLEKELKSNHFVKKVNGLK